MDTQGIDPARSALLVMDFQTAIIGMLGSGDDLLDRMAGAIAAARSRGVLVGYVQVAFTDADYEAIPATNQTFSGLKSVRRLHLDDADSAIHPAVAPQPGDIVVRKVRVGAFSTTDLDAQLRAKGIDTLLLAGISTSGVVLSTLRAAADMDYRCFVVADCCMDPDAQVHEVLLGKVFPRQAQLIDSAALGQPGFWQAVQ